MDVTRLFFVSDKNFLRPHPRKKNRNQDPTVFLDQSIENILICFLYFSHVGKLNLSYNNVSNISDMMHTFIVSRFLWVIEIIYREVKWVLMNLISPEFSWNDTRV